MNIKLNVKKLYEANGHAVQELLKLANFLYKSAKESNDVKVNDIAPTTDQLNRSNQSQIMNKINEIKNARKIASEITLQGADLYDMLTKEAEIRVNLIRFFFTFKRRFTFRLRSKIMFSICVLG